MKGVKELVDDGITTIPQIYVKPEDCRAKPIKAANEGIPTIDLSEFHGDGKPELVKAIADAASKWGFFQVVNHGVPTSVIKDMKNAALKFFHLPLDDKMRFFSEDFKSPLRYGTSFAPYAEDSFDWHDFLAHNVPLQEAWPEQLDSYKKAATDYLESIRVMADVISAALSLGLGLEPPSLERACRLSSVRINYYPTCPAPEFAMGISPHSDFGGFTVLLQDVGGLQVKNEDDWYLLEPLPDAFIVNIADQLQIISNGRYQSAEHRAVVSSEHSRMSIVTFFHPAEDEFIAPLEELVCNATACYRGTEFGTYMKQQFSKRLDSKNGVESLKI